MVGVPSATATVVFPNGKSLVTSAGQVMLGGMLYAKSEQNEGQQKIDNKLKQIHQLEQ